MHRLSRNLYILSFITIIIFVSGWYYQHLSMNRHMLQGAGKVAELSTAAFSGEINRQLGEHARIIEAAGDFISLERWNDNEILAYLSALLRNNNIFCSIYFVTPENRMINASGWEPPDNYDLRLRPWYSLAVEAGRTVCTDAFVNASGDRIIITIASPVYHSDGRLIGVVGGDVSIDNIVAMVNNQNRLLGGFSFLVDGNGVVLAHPEFEQQPGSGLIAVDEIYDNFSEIIGAGSENLAPVKLNAEKGYLAYRPVSATNWHLATFIPLSELAGATRQATQELLIAITATILVFLIFVFYHNRFIHKPLLAFEKNIRHIDLEKTLTYRLPADQGNEFAALGQTINRLLDKVQNYFDRLEEKEQSLKKANHELERLLGQLTTVEEALDYSEEKLYFLSPYFAGGAN